MNLENLMRLAAALPAIPDDRPSWLREMPYVTQSGSDYYKFLWELVKRYKPGRILEIGIDKAGSTLSLAAANPSGQVVSMDVSKDACSRAFDMAKAHGLSNLRILCQDSLAQDWEPPFEPKADLLFLDSWHSFDQVYREYVLYRRGVKDGGIILFDDIRYSKEMAVAWDLIPDPKVDLSVLHHSGFGACQVDPAIQPRPWTEVLPEATRRFS